MTKSGRVLSGKPVVFSIPIDFCIEFWNSTFSPVLEYTEGIFFNFPMVQTMGCIAASILKLFRFF